MFVFCLFVFVFVLFCFVLFFSTPSCYKKHVIIHPYISKYINITWATVSYQTQNSVSIALRFHHLVGLVVKASASRAEDPGFESHVRRDFSWVGSHH